jgi:uncharacterized protein YkwD
VSFRLRTALLLAAVAAAMTVPAAGAQAGQAACASAHVQPSPEVLSQVRQVTLCLLNRERARRGLRPLHLNERLTAASTTHSRNMVRGNFFDHGNFVARILNAHYAPRRGAWTLGENIAWGNGDYATPASTVEAWMDSAGHRANILSRRFRDIGVGVVLGSPIRGHEGGAVYTTDFGARG